MPNLEHLNHLVVPKQWKEYWTAYPHGYTIYEALLSWTSTTNKVIDHVNTLMDEGLEEPLRKALDELADSGALGDLIKELIVIDGGTF